MPTGNAGQKQKHGPKAEAVMRAVVDGAATVFDRVGYRNAVVSALSEESGVSQGLMYHYFASKEKIALAVIQEHQTRWLLPLLSVHDVSSPVGQLVQATIKQIDLLRHDRVARAGLRMSFEPGTLGEVPVDFASAWLEAESELVRRAVESGEIAPTISPEALAQLCIDHFLGAFLSASITHDYSRMSEHVDSFFRATIQPIATPDHRDRVDALIRSGFQS